MPAMHRRPAPSPPRRAPRSASPLAALVWLVSVVSLPSAGGCAEPKVGVIPPPTTARPAPGAARAFGAQGAGLTPTASTMTHKKSDVVDVLHGVSIPDPYRWLEDGDSAETKAFTEHENARLRAFLDKVPGQAELKAGIKGLLEVGFVGAPAVRTVKPGVRRYFHTKREGSQNQPILYVRDGVAGADRVLVDPAQLSSDGTTALDWWYPSWDGSLLAWGRSESGSEESVLFVRDVATGKDLPDRIEHTRHASVAWLPDRSGFYYSRYPEPGSVPKGDEKYASRIFFHKLGDDPKTDKLVFGEGRDKTDVPGVLVSPNGRWLVARVHMGWDKSEVFVKDLAKGEAAPWVPVATGKRALFEPIPRNDRLYLQTNDGAPRYALYAVDYAKPERSAWKRIIAEGADVLDDVNVTDRGIVATFMHEASTRIERFTRDGKSEGPVPLPSIGSAGVTASLEGDELFVSFTSFVVPFEVLRVELGKKPLEPKPWDKLDAKFSASDVEVSVRYATSKDGTRIPMFVIAKKGMAANGDNPTVLYGYGGFNVNQTPAFSARALTTVRRGGVWVSAILRGGGELGEAWHQAGMLEKKQNVFDDFIACAEALVSEKITRPERLGIVGGSNGGLLVSAAITQRPDLFRVGLALVPLTDMLRYHHFRIGKLWIPEYGSADDPEQFKWLHAYSPYHHVTAGTRYPSMLFTTAESDSRVDPLHARKMAARLAEVQTDPTRPVFLRVETKAGHGAGKPITKLTDELTDELTFLFHEIGLISDR
jgi:prolyl oligopeptidase